MNSANSTNKSLHNNNTIPVVITQTARDVAANMAHHYADVHAAEQAYRDTLAAYSVHNYLNLIGIKSVLNCYDNANFLMHLVSNPATLNIPGLGPIQCLAFRNHEQSRDVLPEAQVDRVGYVAVRLDDNQTAEILGFSETVKNDFFSLSQLTPVSQLTQLFKDIHNTANLHQWLEGIYEQDWTCFEEILSKKQLAMVEQVFEGEGIQKARLINLGEENALSTIALCVSAETEDEGLAVRIQVHPIEMEQPMLQKVRFVYASAEVLYPNLELTLYSEVGNPIRKVISRTDPLDNYIQLPIIHSTFGEKFSITVALQDYSVQQHFRT